MILLLGEDWNLGISFQTPDPTASDGCKRENVASEPAPLVRRRNPGRTLGAASEAFQTGAQPGPGARTVDWGPSDPWGPLLLP